MLAHHLDVVLLAMHLLWVVHVSILSNEVAALNLLLDVLEVLIYASLLVVEVLVIVL
jgi:hypothetical protein